MPAISKPASKGGEVGFSLQDCGNDEVGQANLKFMDTL
jgi:hypothetical protein